MPFDPTPITENTQEFRQRLGEIENDRILSEEETAEVESLRSKAFGTAYPSRVITPMDRERYDHNVRATRLALRGHSTGELRAELERAITERDRVMSEAINKEVLHRGASSTDLSEALGVPTSEAHQVINRFHQAFPDRRESYERWREAKAQSEDPTQMLFKAMYMKAGPHREADDTIADGGAFISDLLGGGKER